MSKLCDNVVDNGRDLSFCSENSYVNQKVSKFQFIRTIALIEF